MCRPNNGQRGQAVIRRKAEQTEQPPPVALPPHGRSKNPLHTFVHAPHPEDFLKAISAAKKPPSNVNDENEERQGQKNLVPS
jgi:hypothetical protein